MCIILWRHAVLVTSAGGQYYLIPDMTLGFITFFVMNFHIHIHIKKWSKRNTPETTTTTKAWQKANEQINNNNNNKNTRWEKKTRKSHKTVMVINKGALKKYILYISKKNQSVQIHIWTWCECEDVDNTWI